MKWGKLKYRLIDRELPHARLNSTHGYRWHEDVKLHSTFRTKDLVDRPLDLQNRRLKKCDFHSARKEGIVQLILLGKWFNSNSTAQPVTDY